MLPFNRAYVADSGVTYAIGQLDDLSAPSVGNLPEATGSYLVLPWLWTPRHFRAAFVSRPDVIVVWVACNSDNTLFLSGPGARFSYGGTTLEIHSCYGEEIVPISPSSVYYYTDEHNDVWLLCAEDSMEVATIGNLTPATAEQQIYPWRVKPRYVQFLPVNRDPYVFFKAPCDRSNVIYTSPPGYTFFSGGVEYYLHSVHGQFNI